MPWFLLLRWDSEGIRLRLSMEQKIENAPVCERIEEVTGGWPILLDEVFRRSVGVAPRPAVDDVAEELLKPSPLREQFVASLGMQALPVAPHVLALFRYWDGDWAGLAAGGHQGLEPRTTRYD